MSEYEKGFYACKTIILEVLSGFFAGIFGENELWEKSQIYKIVESIELKKKELEQ